MEHWFSYLFRSMDNNPLGCFCEEKFFREFLDTRAGILSLSNARCSNFNNEELATLDNSRFSPCQGRCTFVAYI